ncbi:MAG: F0F1 ATP synthase subunit B [Pseudonocardia sp.]
MTSVLAQESNNFLLPNATFFVELVLFLIVFWIFARFIIPPLSRAMRERDEMVRKQAEDREESGRRLRQAEERYQSALAEARAEAGRIRDEARADAQRVRDEMRDQADQEVARIRQEGEEYLAAQREQTMQQLRSEIGSLSADLAERIIGRATTSTGGKS